MTTHTAQPNILEPLSFDLLIKVFSLLPRNDVLECMLVSRHWRHSVPHYASQCFADVVLKNDDDYQLYRGLLEHVGIFVKTVVLEDNSRFYNSIGMMPELIPRYFVNVSTLHLEHCCIDQELGIVLSELPCLSQLKIVRSTIISWSSAFIRSILYYCPTLVSLTISCGSPFDNIARDCDDFPEIPPTISTSLQYLDLGDCHEISISNLYDVLKDCPKLKLLVVVKEGDMNENKAILASCCPRLRHLYYQDTPGPIRPITDQEDDDDMEEEETRSNNLSLRGLSIHASDAQSFMEQTGIKHLRLLYAHLSHDRTATFLPSRLIHQNCNTLENLDLSPTSIDALEVLVPSFVSLSKLKRVRIWFRYRDTLSDQVVAAFEQLAEIASQHPTLRSISLQMTPLAQEFGINKGSALISVITNITNLSEITVLCAYIDSGALEDLAEGATHLKRITLKTRSGLKLTTAFFTALARLPLDTLELASYGLERGTLYEAGLRYFVDHCAGSLNRMVIAGNICFDRHGCDVVYAEEKLGKRFKFEYSYQDSFVHIPLSN